MRYTDWLYRMMIFTTVDVAENDNSLWTIIAPGGDAEYYTFATPLSEYGDNPPTHYGTNTAARLEMKAKIDELIDLGALDIAYYLFDYDSDVLMDQRNGTAEIGMPLTWDEAIADQGLQTIEISDLEPDQILVIETITSRAVASTKSAGYFVVDAAKELWRRITYTENWYE